MRTITYHRKPTNFEIAFGYGEIHYIDVPIEHIMKPNRKIKKWFIHIDGLRYYY